MTLLCEQMAYHVRLAKVLEMIREKIKSKSSLRSSFRTFDADKDGFISLPEFKAGPGAPRSHVVRNTHFEPWFHGLHGIL
jgi:hypothetical protein